MKFRYWAIIYIVLSFLLFDPKIFTGGDNCVYMIMAESLVKYGELRDLQFPGEPLHKTYPPGMAFLLAPVVAVFGRSIILFKLLMVLMGVGGFWFYLKIAEVLLGVSPKGNDMAYHTSNQQVSTTIDTTGDSIKVEEKSDGRCGAVVKPPEMSVVVAGWGILPAIFFLLTPVIIQYNHWVLSETPYLCASLGSVYFVIKGEKR